MPLCFEAICIIQISQTECIFCLARFTQYTQQTILYKYIEYIIIIFHHILAESTTFALGFETRMWCFRPGYDEKSYTQHESKESHVRVHVCP